MVDIDALPTVKGLVAAAKAGPLFVLNWGPMDETASAISYLLATNDTATLDRITVISHWTSPSGQYNCNVDANACAYVHAKHRRAKSNSMSSVPWGSPVWSTTAAKPREPQPTRDVRERDRQAHEREMEWRRLARLSDGASFFVLAGFGGGIGALKADGTVDNAGLNRLCNDRSKIATLLEAAATAATGE